MGRRLLKGEVDHFVIPPQHCEGELITIVTENPSEEYLGH